MRQPKKPVAPQIPPPEPVEEEDPYSDSDGIENRDSIQAKKRKISDLQCTPPPATRLLPGSDEGSDSEGKESRKRAAKAPSEGAKKRKSGSRVCGDEDEVCILNHIIDFKREKGADPTADRDAFHKFVIGDLVADLTKTQLYEKIRRFRNKFAKNVDKNGNKENVDLEGHDAAIFVLSKKIWGGGVEEEGEGDGNGNGEGDGNGNGNGKSSDELSKESGKDGNLVISPRKSKNDASVLEEVKDGDDGGHSRGLGINGVDEANAVVKNKKKSKKKSKDRNLTASPGKQKKAQNIGNLAASPVEQKNAQNASAVLEEGLKDGVGFEKEYPYTVQAYASMAARGVITAEQVDFLKVNLSVAGSATSREFEEKWKELLEKETEIVVQKLEVFTHHSRLVLDGMKK